MGNILILAMIQDQERRRENRHGCVSLGLMGHREPWGREEHAQGKSRGMETPGLGFSLRLRAGAHTSGCGVTPSPSPSLNLSLSSFVNWVGWTSDMVTSCRFLIWTIHHSQGWTTCLGISWSSSSSLSLSFSHSCHLLLSYQLLSFNILLIERQSSQWQLTFMERLLCVFSKSFPCINSFSLYNNSVK